MFWPHWKNPDVSFCITWAKSSCGQAVDRSQMTLLHRKRHQSLSITTLWAQQQQKNTILWHELSQEHHLITSSSNLTSSVWKKKKKCFGRRREIDFESAEPIGLPKTSQKPVKTHTSFLLTRQFNTWQASHGTYVTVLGWWSESAAGDTECEENRCKARRQQMFII